MDKELLKILVCPVTKGPLVFASFPFGDHDDYCDSMTMAVMRFRQGGFIDLKGEEIPENWYPRRAREYY